MKRYHYFTDDGVSLCGRWIYLGDLEKDDGMEREDDCKECRRRLRNGTEKTAILLG